MISGFNSLKGSLPEPEFQALETMWAKIENHRYRHAIREKFYDGTQPVKHLGIAVPPQFRSLEVAMGWPARAIDSLSNRIKMEGWTLPDSEISAYGIDEIEFDNQLAVESPQASSAALLHGCAFLATFRGEPAFGEPDVVIQAFPATKATGLWRAGARSLGAALLVLDEDATGATDLLVCFGHVIYRLIRESNTSWLLEAQTNTLGRVPVRLMPFNPSLTRPFGKSFLSRDMMNITEKAMRSSVRTELAAEFFSAPQRYLLGADPEAFVDESGNQISSWDLMLGRLLQVPYNDEDQEMPQAGVFPAASPTPHIALIKEYAAEFAGASGLALDDLGIVHDNPSSAEAIYAGKESLLVTAERAHNSFESAWVWSMITAVQIRSNLAEIPAELKRLKIRWADPSTPSRAQRTDAVVKLISSGMMAAHSEVAMEMAGFSPDQILRIQSERARESAPGTVSQMLSAADTGDELTAAQTLKARADAMGLLIRSGVDPVKAAEQSGLEGLEFMPGGPVTWRDPATNEPVQAVTEDE